MAVSMVVGQMVGSGIFFKVDDVLASTNGNVYAGVMGFIIVGISVVFSAASMANYAIFSPKEGGLLHYVEFRYGKRAAAYVGWVYFIMFLPLLAGVLLTVSGIYISHFLAEFIHFEPNFLHYSLIGWCNGVIFLLLNIFRPKSSGFFLQLTAVLKLFPLIFIAAIGIVSLVGNDAEMLNQAENQAMVSSNETNFWLLVGASFIPIAFSMDGWYIAMQISGEIKDSQKNLPKALISGTLIVLVVYVFYYLGIVSNMSSDEIQQLGDTYIIEFSRKISTEAGAIIIQLFIIISVLGTCNGLVLANTRAPYQFYNLEYSKKFLNLGNISKRTGMPVNSALVGFGLMTIYLLIFYLSNTNPFLKELNYDISAIPILFIYVVNFCLYLGLFKLFREHLLKNKTLKYTMLLFALIGTCVVLAGTLLSPNGLSYLVIAVLFILLGKLGVK